MQPNTVAVNQSGFSTTDTKFAAVLMLFGCRLNHPDHALDATLQYPSKDIYLRSRKDRSIKPQKQIVWNFGHMPVGPKEVFAAYSAKDADQQFDALVDDLRPVVLADIKDRIERAKRNAEEAKERGDETIYDEESLPEYALDNSLSAMAAKLKSAHSAAVAQSCREVLELREHLISILKRVPPLCWEIVVWGKRMRTLAKFPQNASIEVQTSHLNNIS